MPRYKRPRSDPTMHGDGVPPSGVPDAVAALHAASSNGSGSASPVAALVAPSNDELWSLKAVVAKTGLSRSSIYSYVAQGLFPRQRRLGPRRVGWLASEVRAWIAGRPT